MHVSTHNYRLFDAVFCTPDQRNVYMMFVFEPQEASKDNFGFLLVFEIKDSTSSYPIKFIPHPIDRGGNSFLHLQMTKW